MEHQLHCASPSPLSKSSCYLKDFICWPTSGTRSCRALIEFSLTFSAKFSVTCGSVFLNSVVVVDDRDDIPLNGTNFWNIDSCHYCCDRLYTFSHILLTIFDEGKGPGVGDLFMSMKMMTPVCAIKLTQQRSRAAHITIGVSLCILISCCLVCNTNAATIGVGYGTSGDNLPPPETVVQFLKTLNVSKVKVYNTDATVIRAFANSGMDLSITVPNGDIIHMATDTAFTQNWVVYNLQPFVPATTITTIAVGNEILTSDTADTNYLVPAMLNLHSALVTAGLDATIKVSTPHAFSVLNTSFPPSAGVFRPAIATTVMKPMLDFLAQTGAPFMVNIFPYFSYTFNNNTINLDYALLNANATAVTDGNNGLVYTNLWDAQIDAIVAAMAALGHSDIPIVVTESGWPTLGDATQVGPSIANAQTYNNNLVKLVLVDPPKGTPLRPGVATPTYLFSLFNENLKTGKLTEQNWGLYYPNMTPVYSTALST